MEPAMPSERIDSDELPVIPSKQFDKRTVKVFVSLHYDRPIFYPMKNISRTSELPVR